MDVGQFFFKPKNVQSQLCRYGCINRNLYDVYDTYLLVVAWVSQIQGQSLRHLYDLER
ncbi:uncharacterized protein PHALS_03661 [Plasmopara halstedii]|uniref:Uncharacterized protein n=1 Tax=Plasmopara halstedii TaxID=4781 RepID=A0A0N7L7G3_PLAHL|nr:uncharacterized protein PHALS_03661 [Plasmopara halstedii]CEG46995.1 hypothetical protein PHALS_03661 [Plasmopara halstedii]|eukprot:XP_024583364.1 hypothetical protein PHALS_03661 [Plasmopara halstedii]